jgi:signal transduction histidine kinase
VSDGPRSPDRQPDEELDWQIERPLTITSRFVDAAIRRLLRYRPMAPRWSPLVLAGLGAGLAVLAVAQLIVDPEPAGALLVEFLLPGAGALVVLAAARWTTRIDRGVEKSASAVVVSVVFMAVALATVGTILLTQLPPGTGFDYPFAVALALAVGAVVGTPTGFVFDEVIARREALEAEYREVSRLNQHLQVVNRVMRHNVRNELTVALGGLDQLRAEIAPVASGESDRWLDRSTASLERLLTHTEKLLKIESLERSADERVTVDLAEYVEEYLRANDPGEGVHITTDLDDCSPVRAHPLVGTVVVEIVENAVVHNDHDDLDITVRVTTAGDEVEVEVADTGDGIPPGELAALDCEAESPLVHGRGVGLWLIKWVSDVSGGRLDIEANDPCGTVVRLRLPRA